MSLDYDAVVVVSGDGLAHEIFNGFAQHENPRAAFAVPLAPVPTGSGNGCCISLLGLKVDCIFSERGALFFVSVLI